MTEPATAAPTAAETTAVLMAIRDALDTWMWDTAHIAYHIPAALLDGRLTEDILNAYPADHSYPEQLSRAIGHQAGMVFRDDANADEVRVRVDAEAVGVGIEVLRGLMTGDAGIHERLWSFYDEALADLGLTVERVGEVMRHHTAASLTDAARFLMAAHAVPLDSIPRK